MKSTTVLVFAALAVGALAFRPYQKEIPNGDKVPHPCTGDLWPGVGHQAQFGTGDRNPFGVAFGLAGHLWTTALCEADSDGDGESNGKELGDPDCQWTKGGNPKGAANSHPGVCEPVNSSKCNGKNWDNIVGC